MKRLMFLMIIAVMAAMLVMPSVAAAQKAPDPTICLKIMYDCKDNTFSPSGDGNGHYQFVVANPTYDDDGARLTSIELRDKGADVVIMTIHFIAWSDEECKKDSGHYAPTTFYFDASYAVVGVKIQGQSCGTDEFTYSPPGTMGGSTLTFNKCVTEDGLHIIWFCFATADGTTLLPEIATGILMGMGLMALGAFAFIRVRRAKEDAVS